MKKYEYRFESLLNIRGIQEEEAERNFREAVRIYAECVQRLDKLRMEMASLLEELGEQRKASADLRIQRLFTDYIKHLNGRIDTETKIVEEANEKVEERRQELVEAIQERKMIENMRTKDYNRYLVELRRWEQNILDDLTILRFGNENAESTRLSGHQT